MVRRIGRITVMVVAAGLILTTGAAEAAPEADLEDEYHGSSFEDIRSALFHDPYDQLPRYEVKASLLGPPGDDASNRLRAAARRTLSSEADLFDFPAGQKLFQPNGICFTGRWEIDHESPFTGYFSKGSRALLVVRASVALSETETGHRRAFALAGKIFPTMDSKSVVRTANFFAMENLLGTNDDYFLDAVLDNHPIISGLPGSVGDFFVGLRIQKDLSVVDRALSGAASDVTFRPLYPISEIDLSPAKTALTPRWMQLRIDAETPRIPAADFREELKLDHYPGRQLVWQIRVAPDGPGDKTNASWSNIGRIVLSEHVTSRSCDARLHFSHPRMR